MYDVITWRQSVKRWLYSLGNDSIEFLDLKNLENDTNKVAVRLLQPEIQYMTLWRHVMTSSRDVKVLSADRTVLEMIPLNFSTSKTLKTILIKLLYDFYNPIEIQYMTLTSCMTSSRDVKVLSADRTVLEMIPLNFLTSKTYKITLKHCCMTSIACKQMGYTCTPRWAK